MDAGVRYREDIVMKFVHWKAGTFQCCFEPIEHRDRVGAEAVVPEGYCPRGRQVHSGHVVIAPVNAGRNRVWLHPIH